MNITTKGRYALRVMLDLAQHSDAGFVSLKVTAERQNVSLKYLEMIISHLKKAGLLPEVPRDDYLPPEEGRPRREHPWEGGGLSPDP